jgi:hypothetical protein
MRRLFPWKCHPCHSLWKLTLVWIGPSLLRYGLIAYNTCGVFIQCIGQIWRSFVFIAAYCTSACICEMILTNCHSLESVLKHHVLSENKSRTFRCSTFDSERSSLDIFSKWCHHIRLKTLQGCRDETFRSPIRTVTDEYVRFSRVWWIIAIKPWHKWESNFSFV